MRPFTTALTLAFLLLSQGASADDPQKRADALFREAKALTDNGQYPLACPKLEESERLDPALGTEFNLADCYEHTDRPAQAYKLFRAVADAAHVAGKDARERAARGRADALETQIGTAHIAFAKGAPPPGARLALDGAELQDPGSSQVLAAGHHLLQVSGPSVVSWSRDVVVTAGDKVEVLVPDLAAPATESPHPRTDAEPTTTGTSRGRILAYALGGGAIVGLGIGLVAGEISITEHDHAHSVCPHPTPCGDANAAAGWTRATTAGNVSTVGFVSGGALGVAAVVMWMVSPATATARVSSTCGSQGCSLGVLF